MKENSICGDNRFEIIEKAKEMLLNATNIEDSKEEMKVLTNILFRMWQVGLINEEKLEINKLQKENSIEEDIKDIEKYISFTSKRENFSHDTDWNWNKDLANKIEHILSDYKRVLKENEELKEKESRIYKEVQESLSFEKFLIAKDIGPDLFNLGRFYISQIIYDILNNAENPKGIHKENKYIKYIDYIPVQKVKDKIEEIKKEKNKFGNCLVEFYENELADRDIKILQELLEGRK